MIELFFTFTGTYLTYREETVVSGPEILIMENYKKPWNSVIGSFMKPNFSICVIYFDVNFTSVFIIILLV